MTAKKQKSVVATASTVSASEKRKHTARLTTSASANAAAVIELYGKPFGEQDINELYDCLSNSVNQVWDGDMRRTEAMLITQAEALQAIFTNFARRTLNQEYQKNFESFMRMALKAQNQCRMTLETLATIKNPPVVFAKQANIANGPQQVNNGTSAPASHAHGEKEIQSNELLTEDQHGATLDTRGTAATSGTDKAMAPLGEVHRPGD